MTGTRELGGAHRGERRNGLFHPPGTVPARGRTERRESTALRDRSTVKRVGPAPAVIRPISWGPNLLVEPAESRTELSARRDTAVSVLPREQRLVEAIVEVAGTTGPGLDVSELLYNLAANSVDLLDTDTASVHIAHDTGVLETIATCGEDSRYIELFAEHVRDGPSAECYRSATVVSSTDLDLERHRWRAFNAKARRLGFRSVYGIPLRSEDNVVGGLTLLRTRVGPLSDADVAVAQCLATVATLSLVHHQARRSHAAVRDQLEGALDSRLIIEQAKGYLARDYDETPKKAFVRLRAYARRERLPIAVVAEDVVTRRLNLR